jgi:peptide deformylase
MNSEKKSKLEILQIGNPILRKESTTIPKEKVVSTEIKKLVNDLKKVIAGQGDAAAISAVQIGKPVRLFVISKKVLGKNPDEIKTKKDLIFINPKITKSSKNKQLLEEGCLSVKYVYGKVERPEKVTIEACDETGKKFSRGFSGLLAQIVQHEHDHLKGILFVDKAIDLEEMSHEEYDEMLKNI